MKFYLGNKGSHIVENRRIRFLDEIITVETYVFDGVPIEVFIECVDTPLDARFVEFLDKDAGISRSA